MRKTLTVIIVVIMLALISAGCASSRTGVPDPDKIVPGREVLIENLTAAGYSIDTLTSVEGADIAVDRVIARNGERFIDIAYGLSSEDAQKVFDAYCGLYTDGYYILARNGNYVYCVSDKTTFSKAGFTSTDNVGTQYIHD